MDGSDRAVIVKRLKLPAGIFKDNESLRLFLGLLHEASNSVEQP